MIFLKLKLYILVVKHDKLFDSPRPNNVTRICQGRLEETSLHYAIKKKNNFLNYLIVDDKHRLLFCFIPKVASTNWLRFLVAFC